MPKKKSKDMPGATWGPPPSAKTLSYSATVVQDYMDAIDEFRRVSSQKVPDYDPCDAALEYKNYEVNEAAKVVMAAFWPVFVASKPHYED